MLVHALCRGRYNSESTTLADCSGDILQCQSKIGLSAMLYAVAGLPWLFPEYIY